MRILVMNWYDPYSPPAGGLERYLHEIFGRIASYGDEVTILCGTPTGPRPSPCPDRLHIEHIKAPMGNMAVRAMVMILGAHRYTLARQKQFDIVVDCVNKVPFFTPLYVSQPRVSLQAHFNGLTFYEEFPQPIAMLGYRLERAYFRTIYSHEPFVVISMSTRRELSHYGIDPNNSAVVYPGISRLFFSNEVVKAESPTLIYLGRLKKYKRVDLLMEALARVVKYLPKAKLEIVGSGPELAGLQRLAVRLGLSSHVAFHGHLDDFSKWNKMAQAWIHVVLSRKEGWGMAVTEAGAVGVPTVASDVPGLRESVIHGETGFLVPYGDVTAAAEAILKLCTMPELRAAMGAKAKEYARTFNWDSSARKMHYLLGKVISGLPICEGPELDIDFAANQVT